MSQPVGPHRGDERSASSSPEARGQACEEPGGNAERLLTLLEAVEASLDDAVDIAGAIGPEWENVMDDIRGPVASQLSDLRRRLQDRIKLTASKDQTVVGELHGDQTAQPAR